MQTKPQWWVIKEVSNFSSNNQGCMGGLWLDCCLSKSYKLSQSIADGWSNRKSCSSKNIKNNTSKYFTCQELE